MRCKLQWICHMRPGLSYYTSAFAQTTEANISTADVRSLNFTISHLKDTADSSLLHQNWIFVHYESPRTQAKALLTGRITPHD